MNNLKDALKFIKRGAQLEGEGNVKEALKQYNCALTEFLKVIVSDEVEVTTRKDDVLEQIAFYLDHTKNLEVKVCSQNYESRSDDQEPYSCLKEDNDLQLEKRILTTMLKDKPTTNFSNVCGMESAIEDLMLALVLPIKQPQLFSTATRRYRSFLFYGPPGTGKSLLAEAAAGEIKDSTFFVVSSGDLIDKYQGVSEALIRKLFKVARMKKPSIIFINEVDSLALSRKDTDDNSSRRIKTELLVQMDTMTMDDGIFVMAATNTPQSLDDAFLRRFDKLIYVALPNLIARQKMFQQRFSKDDKASHFSEKNYIQLASRTEGFSGADIEKICLEASMLPIKRTLKSHFYTKSHVDGLFLPCGELEEGAANMKWTDIPPGLLKFQSSTTMKDALFVINNVKPSVNWEIIEFMEKFAREKGELKIRNEGEAFTEHKPMSIFCILCCLISKPFL